ncbi:MAG: DegT/DnrJ/EryC1/StrS family aminotransferase [Alphaproteobacteria bacterium]
MTDFLPFALPDIGEEEISAVVDCLESGWMTTGPNAKQFEEDFSAFMGGKVESVAVNSATMGLQLALEALGICAGDEVITTPYTFSATGMSVVHLGAKPVFVDVDPVTLNIDVTKIEAAITERTKAIIPVHFAGLSCEMDKIWEIAERYNLKVIEDAAHALPATYKGQLIGDQTSDATVYSFYATKTITTGEGGMIVTKHPDVAARCRVMRLHGISRDVFDRYTAAGAKWYYEITAPGHKCNLTDIAASIGVQQLKKANKFQDRRAAIAERYLEAFVDLPVVLPANTSGGEVHSWHLFVLQMDDRDGFIDKMGEAGIGTSVHFIPLHHHPFWQQHLNVTEASFPLATAAHERAVSLPIYTKMSFADIERVVTTVRGIFGK